MRNIHKKATIKKEPIKKDNHKNQQTQQYSKAEPLSSQGNISQTRQTDHKIADEYLKLANKHKQNGKLDLAVEYWYKSAQLGNAIAQNWLGSMYQNGRGAPLDKTKPLNGITNPHKRGICILSVILVCVIAVDMAWKKANKQQLNGLKNLPDKVLMRLLRLYTNLVFMIFNIIRPANPMT